LKSWLTAAIIVISALVIAHSPVSSTTWHLDPSGSLTIQDAINSAAAGDTILLSPGTYTGPGNRAVVFNGKDVVVTSSAGPLETIIDCEGLEHAFSCIHGETQNTVIEGLTVTNGYRESFAGAINIIDSSPSIIGNIITNCVAECVIVEDSILGPWCGGGNGGAIYVRSGDPLIAYNEFMHNKANGGEGGAIHLAQSESYLIGNSFYENTIEECCFGSPSAEQAVGAAVYARKGGIVFLNNIFHKNSAQPTQEGGAIYLLKGDHTIRNCTFVSNFCYGLFPVLNSIVLNNANVFIESSIFANFNNALIYGSEIICKGLNAHSLLLCSNIYDIVPKDFCEYDLFNVIYLDPMFVDADNGNFELLPGSPCLPDGNSCGMRMGAGLPQLFDHAWPVSRDTMRVVPNIAICDTFRLLPPIPGINVNFEITGANSASDAVTIDSTGAAGWCYVPGTLGVDTITASAEVRFVSTKQPELAELELTLLEPMLSLGPLLHDGTDSLRVLPSSPVCSHLRLDPPQPGIEVTFEVFGANSETGTAYTNETGEVRWCYSADDLGTDSVIAVAEFVFDSGLIVATESIEFTLLPPELELDPIYHAGDDSLIIAPDSSICSHFRVIPWITGIEIDFEVSGANTVIGSAVTNEIGQTAWCYTPSYIGVDTITALITFPFIHPYTAAARMQRTLLSPAFIFDPARHTGVDTLLAVPGMNICGHFLTEPPVAGATVALKVRGANNLDIADAGTTTGDGSISTCYAAGVFGRDTATATIALDYGGAVYYESSSIIFVSFPPLLQFHPDYHTGRDTVIVDPEGIVKAHFRVLPPLQDIHVQADVRGANTSSISGVTDASGHVALGYPALQAGIDTITATAEIIIDGTPYNPSAAIEMIIIGGGTIEPVTELSIGLDPAEEKILIYLASNKELDKPTALFEFERESGAVERTEKSLKVDLSAWIYSTSFDLPNPGHLTVHIIASDLVGNDVSESRSYDIARVLRAHAFDYRSNDGRVGFYAPRSIISVNGRMLIERQSGWRSPPTDDSGSLLTPLSDRFCLSTNALWLGDPRVIIWHTFDSPMPSVDDTRKIGVYRQSGSVWTYVGGQGDLANVSAEVEIPGIYAAFYNPDYHVVPSATVLFQNHPNPFKPNTTITFELNTGGNAALTVHDVTGHRIRTLRNGPLPAGVYQAEWNGHNDTGEPVASGVYFYRLQTGSFTNTKKMVLVR
jgi:hypothetical protein